MQYVYQTDQAMFKHFQVFIRKNVNVTRGNTQNRYHDDLKL